MLPLICQQLDPTDVGMQANLQCWPPNESQVVGKTRSLICLLSDGLCVLTAVGKVDSKGHCTHVHTQELSALAALTGPIGSCSRHAVTKGPLSIRILQVSPHGLPLSVLRTLCTFDQTMWMIMELTLWD